MEQVLSPSKRGKKVRLSEEVEEFATPELLDKFTHVTSPSYFPPPTSTSASASASASASNSGLIASGSGSGSGSGIVVGNRNREKRPSATIEPIKPRVSGRKIRKTIEATEGEDQNSADEFDYVQIDLPALPHSVHDDINEDEGEGDGEEEEGRRGAKGKGRARTEEMDEEEEDEDEGELEGEVVVEEVRKRGRGKGKKVAVDASKSTSLFFPLLSSSNAGGFETVH